MLTANLLDQRLGDIVQHEHSGLPVLGCRSGQHKDGAADFRRVEFRDALLPTPSLYAKRSFSFLGRQERMEPYIRPSVQLDRRGP